MTAELDLEVIEGGKNNMDAQAGDEESGVTLDGRPEVAQVPSGQAALAVITAAAGAIIALAFEAWVDVGVAEIRGTDADALTSISDGFLVAGLAALILLSAIGVLVRPGWTLPLLPTIGAAAVAIFAIAGYTIATDWHAFGADADVAFIVDGDPTAAPYAIGGLALGIGLVASLLAAYHASRNNC